MSLSAEEIAALSVTDYSMNFDNLGPKDYARVWIKAGPFTDFIVLISELVIQETSTEDVSRLQFKHFLLDHPVELPRTTVIKTINSDTYKGVITWIVDDMVRRATAEEDTSTVEFKKQAERNNLSNEFRMQ